MPPFGLDSTLTAALNLGLARRNQPSTRLLVVVLTLVDLLLLTPRPCSNREHRQNRQRRKSKLRLAQRCPRQRCQHRVRTQSHVKLIHEPNFWCTGEDSNLRSSQGAADLQSAAINHSATCAHFEHPNQRPSATLRAVRRHLFGARSTEHSLSFNSLESRIAEARRSLFCYQRTLNAKLRNSGKTRQQPRSNFRAPYIWEAATGFSSPGELRVSFGLLLLRLAARSKVPILELAKGFEPPTL